MEKHTVVAVDIATLVFEAAVSHEPGRVAETKRLRRAQFVAYFAQMPACVVVMEACGSAHYWARSLQRLGHQVVLLPPHQVRPYVARNKTDRTDANGILEAYRNADIRPVPVKSVPQQVLASIHRFRSGWLASRTAQINTLRPAARARHRALPGCREGAASGEGPHRGCRLRSARCPSPCARYRVRRDPGPRREHQDDRTPTRGPGRANTVVERLRSIPGVGLIIATAIIAFIGDVQRFPSGRHLASYLGLTPREYSTGLRRRLGRISKRGDAYIRMLLIHGARSVLCHAKKQQTHDRLRSWALTLEKRVGHNKAAVALANKLARVIWAVWKNDRAFESLAQAA